MGSLDWKLSNSHSLHLNRSGNTYIANKLLEFSHEIVLANNVKKIPHVLSTLLYKCVSSRLSGFSEKCNIFNFAIYKFLMDKRKSIIVGQYSFCIQYAKVPSHEHFERVLRNNILNR